MALLAGCAQKRHSALRIRAGGRCVLVAPHFKRSNVLAASPDTRYLVDTGAIRAPRSFGVAYWRIARAAEWVAGAAQKGDQASEARPLAAAPQVLSYKSKSPARSTRANTAGRHGS